MTKRDRIVVGVVALAALCAGFFFLVVKPKQAELAQLDGRAQQAQTRRGVALADLAGAQAARVAYRRDVSTLALMGKAVPADDDVPSLLYQLHNAARQAGVQFQTVDVGGGSASSSATPVGPGSLPPGAVAGSNGLAMLPIKVTFAGDFARLGHFLSLVHGFARKSGDGLNVEGRLLTIDGVSLTPSPNGLPRLNAEVVTNAYIASPTPGTPGATGAATPSGSAAPSSSSSSSPSSSSSSTPAKPTPATGVTN